MRPILIDTNAYAAFKRGNEEIVEIMQHVEKIGVSPIVLEELLGGFDHGTKSKQNRKELHQFLESSRIRILVFAPAVGLRGWLRALQCWWIPYFHTSRFVNGC